MDASKHEHDDAGVAAASEAAAPSEAATQVASDGAPAPEADSGAPSSPPSPAEELEGVAEGSSEPEAGTNHQPHPVEVDLEELVARAGKADEYLELAQRSKADFENYRKRAAREAALAQTRGVSKLALELLPAIDNLDRALAAADGTAAVELASGIKLVYDEILAALGRAGIEPFSPQGEPFDPQHHEAVAQQPAPGAEPGTIVEVYQRGYRLGEAVLRPARVSVAG
ncbi:MAG TPA: nucleotide exchange factor GrpE [Solirubrobacteraceae bacterium]|nr:nucleotide exchange factor GrpE [Solirubrobacteraceae bacterium]